MWKSKEKKQAFKIQNSGEKESLKDLTKFQDIEFQKTCFFLELYSIKLYTSIFNSLCQGLFEATSNVRISKKIWKVF